MTPENPGRTPRQPRTLDQSSKLKNVLYEIRGPVSARAAQLADLADDVAAGLAVGAFGVLFLVRGTLALV